MDYVKSDASVFMKLNPPSNGLLYAHCTDASQYLNNASKLKVITPKESLSALESEKDFVRPIAGVCI
jgi:hypothetical protein